MYREQDLSIGVGGYGEVRTGLMMLIVFLLLFFFSSRRRHTRYWRDWSSDVCSSDLSTLWTVLKAGDHVITDTTLYGCTFALMSHGLTKFGVEVSFVDTSDLEAVKKAMKPNTRVVYLETPANPNLKIVDLEEIAKLAHTNPNTLVIVDNTFATPFLQKPLKLGVDIVVHSATKYINGHGDVVAGLAVTNQELANQIRLVGVKDMTGSVLGPQEAYYILRGLKTFEIRMERHCKNAEKVVEYLCHHKQVEKVYYPGLVDHPGYEVAKKQMRAFGGMISFELKGGMEAGKTLLNNLQLCSLAVSLGDTETLIQHPASMTHSDRKSTRLNSSHANISYAVFCLKKKKLLSH